MNISLCLTTFNEQETISELLESLLSQTKSPKEIIIVDGGSTDNTVKIIQKYQQKSSLIKLIVKKCSRSEGRNLSIKASKSDIVAITDGGCVANKNWLIDITKPFESGKPDIVAGFYHMIAKNNLQKAISVYLGVVPSKFTENFLPSTRSIAFTKNAWKVIGGFPESKWNSAEDTDFNYEAVKLGLKYAHKKNAIVEWGIPDSIHNFQLKVYDYAKWDAQYGIWWHPNQRLMSHNIKALSILFRYIIGLILLFSAFVFNWKFGYLYLLVFICIYLIWSFNKVYFEFKDAKIAIHGPVLQIASDLAVMSGFVSGILYKS